MRGTLLATAFAALSINAATAQTEGPPVPVQNLDIDRYSGLWHEMARYQNPMQPRGCLNPTAEYGYDDDGNVAIVNSCSDRRGVITSTTLGTAKQTDPDGKAMFSVDYGDGQADDYWVVAIADDYSWSIVSVPQRDRLWILTREPVRGGPEMAMLIAKAKELGFEPSKLFYSQQGGAGVTSSLEPDEFGG
jgi:apolipoprotein D and lipocalin family protein